MSRRVLWARRIPVGEGTLVADVVLPDDTPGARWPTLVARTPYGRQSFLTAPWMRLVDRGYALVTCDVRGRGDSDGTFRPWRHDTPDGVAVIDWAAAQPWSTAAVGTVGGSYDAMTQWWAARGRPAALRCMIPMAVGAGARPGGRPFMDTGIPRQYWMWWFALTAGRTVQDVSAPTWARHWHHRPLRTLHEAAGFPTAHWPEYVDGEIDFGGPDWALTDAELRGIDVPVLVTVGWWDDQTTLETWDVVADGPSADRRHLVVGPWDHVGNLYPRPVLGGQDVSAGALDTVELMGSFLDRHLRGDTAAAPLPPVRVWRTGEEAWEDRPAFPAPTVPTELHLTGGGTLDADPPTAAWSREWVHDGAAPVTVLTQLDAFASSDPPHDQRYLEERRDVLSFSSAALTAPVRVSGRPRLCATVSADAPELDLFAWVTDVAPDGRSMLPAGVGTEGRRAGHRDGPDPEPLRPGRPVRMTVPSDLVHHTFLPGHRIRLNVAASLAPTYAPQLGSGGHWADETVGAPTTVRLSGGDGVGCTLVLPVEQGDTRPTAGE